MAPDVIRWPLPTPSLPLTIGMALFTTLIVCDPSAPIDPGNGSPIVATVLACGSIGGTVSVTTTPITPSDNALVLLWVASATSDPTNLPEVTGGGLNWDLVETHTRAGAVRRLSVFRGMSSNPSSGPLTIDFEDQEQQIVGWGIVEHRGVDTSGVNGSRAIVETASADAEGFQTAATVRLPPFSSGGSATTAGFLVGTETNVSPGSGFTKLLEGGPPTRRVMVQFQPSPVSTVEASWPDPAHWIGIALELRSAPGGTQISSTPLKPAQGVSCGTSLTSTARKPLGAKGDAPSRRTRGGRTRTRGPQ